MLLDIVILAVSLAVLLYGGNIFVSAVVTIARLFRIPHLVIGSTLVSLTTTSPEMAVSVMSGITGQSSLALGNAIGSCICNIALIIGTTVLIKEVRVHYRSLRPQLLWLGGSILAVAVFTWDGQLTRLEGWILIAAGLAYFGSDLVRHLRHREPDAEAEAAAIGQEKEGGPRARQAGVAWLTFLVGATVVVVASRFLVSAATSIAAALGIPSIIIGLTVVAVGTSLPEFVTSVTSARKNVSDIGVGNVLGANIANLTLIIGVAAVFAGVPVQRSAYWINIPALLICLGLFVQAARTEAIISRREGVVMLGFYVLYIGVLVATTVMK